MRSFTVSRSNAAKNRALAPRRARGRSGGVVRTAPVSVNEGLLCNPPGIALADGLAREEVDVLTKLVHGDVP